MKDLIRRALDNCGYEFDEPTEENLIRCFYDYVDTGAFSELDYDTAKEEVESGEITIEQIVRNLIRL